MRIKGAKTGRIFSSRYSNKCLHLASEKIVLACESNLSLATGLEAEKLVSSPESFMGRSYRKGIQLIHFLQHPSISQGAL